METSIKKSSIALLSNVLRGSALLIVFVVASTQRVFSQADVSNLKNSLSSIQKEQERIAHEEFMSYVYMTVGFAVVIAIAWSTTVMARKRNKREQEEKQRFIMKQQELRKQSGQVHKARR